MAEKKKTTKPVAKKSEFTDRRDPVAVELENAYRLVEADKKTKLQNLGKETKNWLHSLTDEQMGHIAVFLDQNGVLNSFRAPATPNPEKLN